MKTLTHDFRLYLQRELIERCRRNPKYSLRAFAKHLRVNPSALSDILNQKRTLTNKMKIRLGSSLGLGPFEMRNFMDPAFAGYMAQSQTITDKQFESIDLDVYALIADWYYYAILELVAIKGFKSNAAWVAKKLGLTKSEVNIALERLLRTGLLKIVKGKWVDTGKGFTTNINGDLTTTATRQLQKQLLEKSIRALEELPIGMRNHTSMTMAINPKDLPLAIEKIKTFRRELCALLGKNKELTDVYNLSVAFFPVTVQGDKK